jgi:hypothetical protein
MNNLAEVVFGNLLKSTSKNDMWGNECVIVAKPILCATKTIDFFTDHAPSLNPF